MNFLITFQTCKRKMNDGVKKMQKTIKNRLDCAFLKPWFDVHSMPNDFIFFCEWFIDETPPMLQRASSFSAFFNGCDSDSAWELETFKVLSHAMHQLWTSR